MSVIFKRMVTLKDIARETGISVAATSMAIRDHDSISAETKQRVWDAQTRLGYCLPQRRNRKSAANGTGLKNIAFVLVDRTFQDTAYSNVFQGIATAAVEKEISPIYLSVRYDELIEGQIPPVLRNRETGGIIVSGNYDLHLHEHFERLGLPLVVLGNYHLSGKSFVACESDTDQGIALILSHFHELGHQRIGLIQNTLDTWYERQILGQFRAEVKRLALDQSPDFHQIICEVGSATAAAIAMLSSAHRPTAILVSDEHAVRDVYEVAAKLRLEIPTDLSVGALGASERPTDYRPALTMLGNDNQRIGREALSKLIRLAGGSHAAASREIFPMRLLKGKSTGNAPDLHPKRKPRQTTSRRNGA